MSACGATLGSIYDGGASAQSGATTVVEQQDAWLIQLDAAPVATDAYYAGWDASGITFSGGYSIHHALGDDKQCVAWYGKALLQQIPAATLSVGYDSTFWGVVNQLGNVGAGASGAALFDPNNHVVGSSSLAQLPGGANSAGVCPATPLASASASYLAAQYTALSAVWTSTADTTSTTGSTTLQSVLDPTHSAGLVSQGLGTAAIVLQASQSSLTTGDSLTLTWNVAGAQTCTASGGSPRRASTSNRRPVAFNGPLPWAPVSTWTAPPAQVSLSRPQDRPRQHHKPQVPISTP